MTDVAFDQLLRTAGLRVTAPRLAVLKVLTEATDHPTIDQVRERVTVAVGTVSTQAIYDVCDALRDAGLVRRIEPAGSAARFEARVGDNHHHLVCRGCGRVVDVDCAVGAAPCLEAADAQGFEIDEAEVTYWGRCADCQPDRAADKNKKGKRR